MSETTTEATDVAATNEEAFPFRFQRLVADMHDAFRHPNGKGAPAALGLDRIPLRTYLINEEGVDELERALTYTGTKRIAEIIDSFVDLGVVSLGTLVEMGVPIEVDLAVAEHKGYVPVASEAQLVWSATVLLPKTRERLADLRQALEGQDLDASVALLTALTTSGLRALADAGFDPVPFIEDIQDSNMSKLLPDGTPLISRGIELDGKEAGKFLPGPNTRKARPGEIYTELYAAKASPEFVRGAQAAAEAMSFYFLNEDEQPIYADLTLDCLEQFREGAVADAVRDEEASWNRRAGEPVVLVDPV